MTRVAALEIKRNTPLASGYQVLGKFTQFRLAFSISPTADMKQANNDMQSSQGGWVFPEDLLFAGVGILQGLSGHDKGSPELCHGTPGVSGKGIITGYYSWFVALMS